MIEDAPRYTSLRDYLRVVRDQKWIILALVVVAAGAALYFSERQPRVYEATASISFADEAHDLQLLGTSVTPGSAPDQSAAARAKTIDEPAVTAAVKRQLRLTLAPEELKAKISAAVDNKSGLVDVTGQSDDPALAARLANSYSEQAATQTNSRSRLRFRQAAAVLRLRLRHTRTDPTSLTERASLSDQIARLSFLQTNSRPATVVTLAQTPGAPISPTPVRDATLAGLGGLVIGLILAFLRDSLDRRLRGAREIETELGYAVLGHVRAEAMGKTLRAGGEDHEHLGADLEAFRMVRQNLTFLAEGCPLRTAMVTSALPEEGKSTVAASLAFAMASVGRRTLLVECDVHRPSLAGRLGLDPGPGLNDLLAGATTREAVTQSIPMSLPSLNGNAAGGAPGPSLECITAGTRTTGPMELFESPTCREFMAEVSKAYDMVILDTGPLLLVADTLELLPQVDAVILCVRSSQTTRDQALSAAAAIEHYPRRPTGLVVTGLTRRDEAESGYDPYAYAYSGR